jgi:hypothetical protein
MTLNVAKPEGAEAVEKSPKPATNPAATTDPLAQPSSTPAIAPIPANSEEKVTGREPQGGYYTTQPAERTKAVTDNRRGDSKNTNKTLKGPKTFACAFDAIFPTTWITFLFAGRLRCLKTRQVILYR